jgi:hypothetical protein
MAPQEGRAMAPQEGRAGAAGPRDGPEGRVG